MFVFHCCCFLLLFAICECASPTASLNPVIYAEVGQPLTLNCSLRVWYKDNIPIPTTSSSRTEILQDGSLFFRSLDLTQSGWYTCANSTNTEREELLIVGARPRLDITYSASSSYTVLPNSRVELPCAVSGTPTPTVEWRDGNDVLIMNGNSFRIDQNTQSLVIGDYTNQPPPSHQGPYYCLARNQFDDSTSDRIYVNVTSAAVPMMYDSPLNSIGTAIELASNQSSSYQLRCTGHSRTILENTNYTLQWEKNFMIMVAKTRDFLEVTASPANSGYYCCSVTYNMEVVSRHCVTVWIRERPSFMLTPLSAITLPSGRGRSAQLLCITNNLIYNPPKINWQINGVPVVNETGLTVYNSVPVGLNFLRVADVSINGNQSTTFTCVASNLEGEETANVSVSAVELCQGSNMIVSGDAETSNTLSFWNPSNENASAMTVNNEKVFVLSYSGPGTTLTQSLSLNGATAFQISGRIRQTSVSGTHRGIAVLRVIINDNFKVMNFENPAPFTSAWQWVGQTVQVPSLLTDSPLTLELVVIPSPGMPESTLSGVAYFDDICISLEVPQLQLNLIIGAAVGGAAILILLLLILLVCCCCCCCRKKGEPRMMKKMSINVGKKLTKRWTKHHDNVVSELKTTSSKTNVEMKGYTKTSGDTGRPISPRISPLFPPVSPPAGNLPVHVENTDGEYADPREYDYVDGQTPKIQVEIGRPARSSNGGPESVYTALNPQALDEHNVYTTATPVSHRSTSSLHDEIEDESEYVDVEPAHVASYLQLIPGSYPSKSSIRSGSLSPPITNGSLPEGSRRTHSELSPTRVDPGELLYANQEELYVNDPRNRSGTSPANLDPVSGEIYSYVNDV